MTKVEHARDTLPPLTEAQRGSLKLPAEMQDDEIKADAILELTKEQLAEMKTGAIYRPVKKQITTRVDSGCAGVAQVRWKGLSVTHECHPPAGDAERERNCTTRPSARLRHPFRGWSGTPNLRPARAGAAAMTGTGTSSGRPLMLRALSNAACATATQACQAPALCPTDARIKSGS